MKNWKWWLDIAMVGIGAFLLWKSVDLGEAYANHWLRESGGTCRHGYLSYYLIRSDSYVSMGGRDFIRYRHMVSA
ncbi:hypothetical protein V2P11_00470 [Parageobacillus toebii]|uniref:hypothetical protein n=1 Tax=Parageobacillus toebii TaxID=153151 RepID=UPI0035C72678